MNDVKTIRSAIKAIAQTGAKLDAKIQATGLAILAHVEQHGDVSLANELFNAMPKGSRTASLAGWLMAYGKLRANTGKDKATNPFRFDATKATDLPSAEAVLWHTFGKPEQAPDELFDLNKAITALIAKAKKADKVSDPELLTKLEGMVS